MNNHHNDSTSDDVRRRVVDAYVAGSVIGDISRIMGVKIYTVRRIIKAFVSQDKIAMAPRGGNRKSM
jgi:transposase-like protein